MEKRATKYIMNSPVLTEYGNYSFKRISLDEAKEFIKDNAFSAVGHEATSRIMSELLEKKVETNRVQIRMEPGDAALIFRLKTRIEEGKILSYEEIKDMLERGLIEFGLLERKE